MSQQYLKILLVRAGCIVYLAKNDNRPSDDHMAQRAEVRLVTWVVDGVARHLVGGALDDQGVDVVVGVLVLDLVDLFLPP